MKVYVVISDVVYDMEGEPSIVGVYADKNVAIKMMQTVFDNFVGEGWIPDESLEDEDLHSYGEMGKSIWEEGCWAENHIYVFVEEHEVQ